MGYEHLEIERGNGVVTGTPARPATRNALNAALVGQFGRSVEELAEDNGIRVVLAGEVKHCCARVDIGYMRDTARCCTAGLRAGEGQEGLSAFLEGREPIRGEET